MSVKSDVTMEMAETPEAKSLNPSENNDMEDKGKHKSSLNYFLELLSDSVVTGVPQIVTVSNILRKVFKILVLAACIGGFIYQAVEFMKLYNTYPSSLDIEVEFKNNLLPPTVTICNRNPVQRTQFCKAKGQFCAKPTNLSHFCDMYPRYCTEETTVNDLEFLISDHYIERDDIAKFGQRDEDFINECCIYHVNCGNGCRETMRKVTYLNENNKPRNCYIIDFDKVESESNVGSFDDLMQLTQNSCAMWNTFDIEQMYSVVVNLDQKENSRPDTEPAAQAVVHSYNNLKSPFQKGFVMEEGKRYTVTLRAFEEYLLPAPYSTSCTDNSELDDDYNREACLSSCSIEGIIQNCGCVPDVVPLSVKGYSRCSKLKSAECLITKGFDEESCFWKCPRPCHFSSFEYEVTVSNFENPLTAVDLGDGPVYKDDLDANSTVDLRKISNFNGAGKAILNVVYSKREVTVFKYKPKYEKIEILGYIGGFSGIWLGISLVAIFDFIETVTVFFCFLGRKVKARRSYNTR